MISPNDKHNYFIDYILGHAMRKGLINDRFARAAEFREGKASELDGPILIKTGDTS